MPNNDSRYDLLAKVIKEHKNEPGPLMPILQETQNIFDCVPEDVQKIIAKELNITLSDIYGVVTFYSQFTLKPRGKHKIQVCMGTACYVKGASDVLNRISHELNVPIGQTTEDGKYTLIATRCLGACGLAPVLTINEDVYGRLVADDVPRIVKEYETKHNL